MLKRIGKALGITKATDAAPVGSSQAQASAKDSGGSSGVLAGLMGGVAGQLSIGPNFVNPGTGAGTNLDHQSGSYFTDVFLHQLQLEIIYRVSWAAGKMIDIPVDDMFVPGRHWTGDDESAIEAMEEAERQLEGHQRLSEAMKAGRLYGSGLLVIISQDQPTEMELKPEEIREGSIANLLVVERWAVSIEHWHIDPRMPNYGKPYMYRVSPRLTQGSGDQLLVHHSRVLRFDGIRPPLTEGWNYWDRDWGASELTRAINEIGRDEHMAISLNQLLHEASIQVVKLQGFKEAVRGNPDPDDPSPGEMAGAVNAMKSMFRTAFLDIEDETERLQASFGGIADIFNGMAQRLAAIADIPMTRFFGMSPAGLNATGQSDMENYAIRVASLQKRLLSDPLRILDMVLARHVGLNEPPEYEWLPLLSMSPKVQAETTKLNMESITQAVTAGVIDEDEARERLSQEPLFGELPQLTPEMRERMEMRSGFVDPGDVEGEGEEPEGEGE